MLEMTIYSVAIIAVMIIMQDIYGIKTVFCEKCIHFVLGVPPIIVIALGYYFSAVKLI